MPTAVKMPQLGESIVEGIVARWLKAPGDPIAKLEPLLEVSTDKIDTEIPSPASGTVLDVLVAEGVTVATGTILAYIGDAGESAPMPAGKPTVPATPDAQGPTVDSNNGKPTAKPTGRAFISPVVGRISAEHNIDIDQVPGTGMNGRVTKQDILAFIQAQKTGGLDDGRSRGEEEKGSRGVAERADSGLRTPDSGLPTQDEVLQPLTTMRRAIAQHMVQSKQISPHVTTIFEVDMTAVVQHRAANKVAFAVKGINLTFTPYFMAATADALRAVPAVNSRFTSTGIMINQRIHIGVAVALEDGLIVPVVRDADEKNLQGLARAVNMLSTQARDGDLAPDDLQGGTFTITNHGVSGSLIGTPIINQPQAGILGVGAIVKRPVVRSTGNSLLPSADDAIVIRPMCYLNFTFDHRVLDGAQADRFVATIKDILENWHD